MPRSNRSLLCLALLATPVMAAPSPFRSAEVWRGIEALQAGVNRADMRDRISRRQAAGLRAEIAQLKAEFRRDNSDGLTPSEAATLEDRIRHLHARLAQERRDSDSGRG